MFAFGSWWMVTLASFIIGITGLMFAFWLFLEPLNGPKKFGVVVDAGSSHSEVFVFTWNGEMPLGTADVKLLHRCFISGGVNSFATHADDLRRYFGPCLAETEAFVPSFHRPDALLYVGATAGMRILRKFDPEGAQAVLATIREFLGTNTTFQVVHDNVNILSGSEEGISGWIIVNYLMNHLKQWQKATAAVLDVGGASMQVTSEQSQSDNLTTTNITLFNQTHKVYSQSFLCYGIGQAQHRYDFLLINGNKTKGGSLPSEVTIDPCLAKGVTHKILPQDINGPCTLTDDSKPVLLGITNVDHKKLKKIFKNYQRDSAKGNSEPHGITLIQTSAEKVTPTQDGEGDDESSPLYVQGSSNAATCAQKMSQLFDVQLCKNTFTYGDCMDAQSVPTVNGTLVAFSGLFYHLMLLLHVQPNITLEEFKKAVFDVCSLESEVLYTAYPGLEKEIVEDLCFDAMFVYTLFTLGLGINNSTWTNVQFTDELNNTEVVWPQGFMMNRTSSFVSETPQQLLTITTFMLLVLLFSAFVISGILFLRHSLKIKRNSASYQRVIADHIDQELHRFI
ncbi:ectonucleoside triphosphate diphosphohydrolase 2-like isoform X2 [Homarus americanus]|nr:ectonucleoside triphosphate diphosphohydrolase 2-like isoform X2 [Homarus americanus]